MKLKLVKLENKYKQQLFDMLDEWYSAGEKIVPYAIRKTDYHDFEKYCGSLEVKDDCPDLVPDSTFFCLDEERNIFVGAVNIRHYLNESLLLNGGHIGDGVRPSERRKGIATQMIHLALLECKRLGIDNVLMVCDKENIGSAKSIIKNGGVLENEINVDGVIEQRYWIDTVYCMEFIDIYDDLGQKCGKCEDRNEVHRKALIHKGVCVWIMNSEHELLFQTRNSHVMFPNMLDISFSGHVLAGETSLEAAKREGREELGISIDISKLQYLFSCREYGGIDSYFENEIDDVFLYRADIPINEYSFCDNEVEEVRYIPLDEFKMMVESNSSILLPYETHYHFLLIALNSRLLHN